MNKEEGTGNIVIRPKRKGKIVFKKEINLESTIPNQLLVQNETKTAQGLEKET